MLARRLDPTRLSERAHASVPGSQASRRDEPKPRRRAGRWERRVDDQVASRHTRTTSPTFRCTMIGGRSSMVLAG